METENIKKLDLLRKIRAKAEEILLLTSHLVLTGEVERNEKEVDDYAFLMDKREPLIQHLAVLKERADVLAVEPNDMLCTEEQQAVEKLITDIIALDKKHKAKMLDIMASVKNSIKGINNGKKLSNVYAQPMEDYGFLDTKK